MSLLQVAHISKQIDSIVLLNDINFTQQPAQKIAIAGATGSGKTTLLKIIAGWMQPDSGEVLLDGVRIKGPEEKLMPGHPRIAYLSQHFELLNHYRVAELLEMNQHLTDSEAEKIYAICRINHLLQRWTHQLSGGEKQRIALARLLVAAPQLLLLDEPYSNLDAIHTAILKMVVEDISARLTITCLLVSHDPVDILPWADELLLLQEGKLIQHGTPLEVYHQPANEYAAALLGNYTVLDAALVRAFSVLSGVPVDKVNKYIRPGHFKIVANKKEGLKATVEKVHFMGDYCEVTACIAGNNILIHTTESHLKKGDTIYLSLYKL